MENLNESGLSRLWDHAQKHDFGTITAFRARKSCDLDSEPYTKSENKKRNASLLSKLRAKGFGVTAISGVYIENYGTKNAVEVKESSFFVADIQDKGNLKKELISLGVEFEQDCILFGKKGGDGELIGTGKCPDSYPGFGKKDKQGGAIFGKNGEFMSKVKGRPFIFGKVSESYAECKYPTELRGQVARSKVKWQDIELSEDF